MMSKRIPSGHGRCCLSARIQCNSSTHDEAGVAPPRRVDLEEHLGESRCFGLPRLFDAVIDVGVALVVSQILFPPQPLRLLPRLTVRKSEVATQLQYLGPGCLALARTSPVVTVEYRKPLADSLSIGVDAGPAEPS